MNQPELRKHAFSVVVIERIFLHGDSVNDILALSFSHSPSASKFNMKKHHLTNFNAFDSRCNFKCHCGRKSTSWRAAWRAERWILHTTSGFKPGHKNANRASTSWWKSWLFSDEATSSANLCFSFLAEHYAMRSVLYSGEHFYPGTQTIDNDIRQRDVATSHVWHHERHMKSANTLCSTHDDIPASPKPSRKFVACRQLIDSVTLVFRFYYHLASREKRLSQRLDRRFLHC